MQNKVVIVSAVRTPLGCFMGSLSNFSAVELGIYALNGALSKIDLDRKEIDEFEYLEYNMSLGLNEKF